jgi:hypothetical protein
MTTVALKDALSPKNLKWVEAQLTNDENASDEEMQAYFVEGGLTPAQAQEALTYRKEYMFNLFHEDHTPIKVGREKAKAFDPSTKTFRRPRFR